MKCQGHIRPIERAPCHESPKLPTNRPREGFGAVTEAADWIKKYQQALSRLLLLRPRQIVAPADESVHTTS